MTSYNYSISQNFPNGINTGQLSSEILNSTQIQKLLYSVVIDSNDPDNVIITFEAPLTTTELNALNTIISNHQPEVIGEKLILQSSLADNEAIEIIASNIVGGIAIRAGTGGISVETTNAFTVESGAETSINVTNGNLILNSTNALTNIDGYSGINIGNNSSTGPINIASSAQRSINIGNTIGNTGVTINTGTNGLVINTTSGPVSLNSTGANSNITHNTNSNGQDLTIGLTGNTNSSIRLESEGTGDNAILLNATGGVQLYAENRPVSIVSNAPVGNAVTIDTNAGTGGITLSSGIYGIAINANGGVIGIGHFSGGNIYLGTASIARDIIIGNTTNGTNLFLRNGNAHVISQRNEVALSDTPVINLTIPNILSRILYGSPTSNTTLNLPTAANIISLINNIQVNDAFDFSIINQSSTSIYTLSGSTIIGNAQIIPNTSGLFRLKITNITSGTEAFIVYRIA
ncbi:hypothetical protein [Moumouvirus maliensis]|nr:hypothetical protein [Moumouvirus maliensis]